MSAPSDIIEEYLVSLGFKVNNTQLNSLLKGLETAKSQTASFAGKMTKNLASSGVAIVSFIATAAVATGKFLESMADADMETEKLSRHLWITEESARSLQNALSSMGEDLGSLNDIAMNPELRGQFTELYKLSKQLSAPQELQDQLKFIRSITFELKKMKLIANYTMQNVAFYLSKYLGKNLGNIKDKLQFINDFLIRNMPKISNYIAKGLYTIIRLGETLVTTVFKIIQGVMWFFDKMPPKAKLAMAAMAAAGFMALNPFTLFVGSLLMILLLLEDYYGYTQGKKSLLGGMWESVDGMATKFGDIATEANNMVESLTGMTSLEIVFSTVEDLVSKIASGFKLINEELELLSDFMNGDSSATGLNFYKRLGGIGGKIGSMNNIFAPGGFTNLLSEQIGSMFGKYYDPFSTPGASSTSKTSNVNVEVKQTINSSDPVLAGKESARYINSTVIRSLNNGVAW